MSDSTNDIMTDNMYDIIQDISDGQHAQTSEYDITDDILARHKLTDRTTPPHGTAPAAGFVFVLGIGNRVQ